MRHEQRKDIIKDSAAIERQGRAHAATGGGVTGGGAAGGVAISMCSSPAMSNASASNLRLTSDLKTMKQNPPEGVSASPLGDENLHVWGGTIFGTDDTAWEGGIFSMRLTFPEQYPDKPPRVRFTSEMVRGMGSNFFAWRSQEGRAPAWP